MVIYTGGCFINKSSFYAMTTHNSLNIPDLARWSWMINDPSSPFQTNSGPICNVAEWRQDSMKLEIAIRSMTSKGKRTENNLSIHNLIRLDKIKNVFSCQTWNLLHVMFLPFHPCFNFKHPKNQYSGTRQAALDLTKRLLLTRLLRPNSSAQASRQTKWRKNMR